MNKLRGSISAAGYYMQLAEVMSFTMLGASREYLEYNIGFRIAVIPDTMPVEQNTSKVRRGQ